MFALIRRLVPIVGTILFSTVCLLAVAMTAATGLELFLKARSHYLARQAQNGAGASLSPRFDKIDRAYEPFLAQSLNPQYFFFFPLDATGRVAISTETATLDADGFRGPGPANVRGRRLAFLLGGSAAFGWDASSDATTITGYLNRLQDQYFFVNAAVPSWNSSQEMSRVAFQILDYHPALVVTYDGFNDAVVTEDYYRRGFTFPVGTPAHFDALAALVDRSSGRGYGGQGLLEYVFPELAARIHARSSRKAPSNVKAASGPEIPDSAVEASASRYLSNLAGMRDLTAGRGARYIAIFQPVALLHRHVRADRPFEQFKVVERFHKAVMAKDAHALEFHDLGNLFDQYFESVPVRDPDITDRTVFVDGVHLGDAGNELVARHLSQLLR